MSTSSHTGKLVVTTINEPNDVLQTLARGALQAGLEFIIVGDRKSPDIFELGGTTYLSLQTQQRLPFSLAAICPEGSYARKNLGYLYAMNEAATFIVETDDDNYPVSSAFYEPLPERVMMDVVTSDGWHNVYRNFTSSTIWPRGLPLEHVLSMDRSRISPEEVVVPIQQGLADENPDVDAIYRLTRPLPISFEQRLPVALGAGTWCPFNSQNTVFLRSVFPLLYLPSFCSFRMTDIWRSFVAQIICWVNGWNVAFRSATVRQDRNDHDLMRDFADEVPGYLHNDSIRKILSGVALSAGQDQLGANLLNCYSALIEADFVGAGELELLGAWLRDCRALDFA